MPQEPPTETSPSSSSRPFRDQIAVRLPFLVDLAAAGGSRIAPGSPLRRRGIKLALAAAWGGINRGDFAPARLFYERDAEVFLFGAEGLGLEERYAGESGWMEFFHDMFENFDEPRIAMRRLRDGGDRIVAEVVLTGRGKASGVEVVQKNSTIYYFSPRGKIARQDIFWQRNAWDLAVEAAGLSE